MFSFDLKSSGFFSLIIILIAFWYKKHVDDVLSERMSQILSGLLRAESKVTLMPTKVLIGFGGCVDVFTDAMQIISVMNLTAPSELRHHQVVHNENDLMDLIAFFFRHGAAAERYVDNSTLFKKLVQNAKSTSRFEYALGGNAPIMAKRMALEGHDVTLAARLSVESLDALPKNVKVLGDPLDSADIHLVMEYIKGDNWNQFIAPRANRLILHNDVLNPYLPGLEEFTVEAEVDNPHLVVVAGLQILDNFPLPHNDRQVRLAKLGSVLSGLPLSAKVHFEMASFTDKTLLQEILHNVIMHSDSIGMNEQELSILVSLLDGREVSIVSDSTPRVATVLDQMRIAYSHLVEGRSENGQRPITRLHVHTLAFQAILTVMSSTWRNTMSASAKASLVAHRHVCGSHKIDLQKTVLLMDHSFSASEDSTSRRVEVVDNRPVSCWQERGYQICVAPGLVCTDIRQTAGSGDNISSASLVLQV